MVDHLQALLDHPFLSRLGNLRTLLGLVGVAALVLVAVALFELLTHAGWVPDLFLGLALVLLIATGAERVKARRMPSLGSSERSGIRFEYHVDDPATQERRSSFHTNGEGRQVIKALAGMDWERIGIRETDAETTHPWDASVSTSKLPATMKVGKRRLGHWRRDRVTIEALGEKGLDISPQATAYGTLRIFGVMPQAKADAIVREAQDRAMRARTLVPPKHRELLWDLLDGAVQAIKRGYQFRHDEEGATSHTHQESFAAHFSHAANGITEWNTALFDRAALDSDLGHRALSAASTRGMLDSPYLQGSAVPDVLLETTRAHIRKNGAIHQLPQIKWDIAKGGLGVNVRLNDTLIAIVKESDARGEEDIRREIEMLLREIQEWPEAAAIADAERCPVFMDKQNLLNELRDLRKQETILFSEACPICRGNAGLS